MNMTRIYSIGIIQVLIGAILISFAPVFVKLTVVGPTISAFYRVLFGGVVLLGMAIYRREPLWLGWKHFGLVWLCGASFAGDLAFWHRSVYAIGPGLATIITNFQIFFIATISIAILRVRPGWKFIVAIIMAIVGSFLLVGVKWDLVSSHYHLGVFYGLIAALFYTGFILSLRKLQQRCHQQARAANFINVALLSLACAVILGITGVLQHESFVIPNAINWLWLLDYGIICQAIAWLLISQGLPRIPVTIAGLLLLMQPAFAFIWGIVIFHQPTPTLEWIGAIIALTAIYLGTISHKRS